MDRGSIISPLMSNATAVIILVALLGTGTLLAGRAGIRSLQRARKVVFYRTRKAYTVAGWQWLVLAFVLFSSTVASALYGEPVANQIFPPTAVPISVPVNTSAPAETATVLITSTERPSGTPRPNLSSTPSPDLTQTDATAQTPAASMTPTRTLTLGPTATSTRTVLPSPTTNLSALSTNAAATLQAQLVTAALSHTPTRTRTFTPVPSLTATRTRVPSLTPTITPNLRFSATPSPTRTPWPTATHTRTPLPTSTLRPTRTPPPTVTLIPTFTHTFTPTITRTRTPRPTLTLTSTHTPRPTGTRTQIPTRTPTSTPSRLPSPTHTPMFARVNVYFTDNDRLINGQLPYEVAVTRSVPTSKERLDAVLDEFFKGPSDVERNSGLAVISNGFTGYSKVELLNGGAHVYLTGSCQSNGTLYNITHALMLTLKQFPEVQFVKIYDQFGQTREPLARLDSIPACLDPRFTPSVTPLPTSTLALRGTPTRTARP